MQRSPTVLNLLGISAVLLYVVDAGCMSVACQWTTSERHTPAIEKKMGKKGGSAVTGGAGLVDHDDDDVNEEEVRRGAS